MKVLFLTIAYPKSGDHNIYSDLMDEFVLNKHQVFVTCSMEKRFNQKTSVSLEEGKKVLRIRTGNLTGKVNLIEKGLSTVTLENIFIHAIKSFFQGISFDLILYSTPPITFAKAVAFFKKRDSAKTYLLLKDIFPQNAVDIKMLEKNSLIYRAFRRKEKKLYALSDYIGCMSQANVDYILKHNKEISRSSVEVCPNSIRPGTVDKLGKEEVRNKYGIPDEAVTFIYGGNLGKPQNIDYVIECLTKNINLKDRYFIICGNGVEYYKLEAFKNESMPSNVLLIEGLPKKEYNDLVTCCDIGLIFLDHRFTIPNFPSRLLSYMEYELPVFASTDANTDIGTVIREGKFGWWCESNDSDEFKRVVDSICLFGQGRNEYRINSRKYLEENYTVEKAYRIIMKHFI